MEMPTHNGCYVGQRQIGLGSCICQLTLKGIELTTRAFILECQAEQRPVGCKPLTAGTRIAELSELLKFIDEIVTSAEMGKLPGWDWHTWVPRIKNSTRF